MTKSSDGLEALRVGRAFVDLSAWRKVHVAGAEARGWLNDLITADIAGLEPGGSARSLLLTPTGRIRADFAVAPRDDGFLLLQDPEQPVPVDSLLAPYVLSSDVHLEDRTARLALFACPGSPAPRAPALARWSPSCLGEGTDLLEDSLPHEADLDRAVGYDKGCFLGQEALAKVRNLGHPPHVVLAAIAGGAAGPGDAITAEDGEVGLVTSATPLPDGRTAAIVRIRWGARDAPLATPDGAPIRPTGPAS